MGISKRIVHKVIRIIEGPPVRERTVVKVIHADQGVRLPAGFIVGVYRSGTTLLRYVLDSHSHIAVPPESNFLVTLADLWTSEWNHKGFKGIGIDEEGLLIRIRDFAGGIFDDYARAKGKVRWFDKTPSYIEILDFLQIVFGEQTRYIMLYRHGLDVATSLVKAQENNTTFAGPVRRYADRYGVSPRLAALRYWVDQCERMLVFEAQHPDQCVRIRYEDYAARPAEQLPPLFDFLQEPWEPAALHFADKAHDFGLQDYKILESRDFTPSLRNYAGWAAEELAGAEEIAGPMLARLGYAIEA
jgi:hypothetical protein